MPSALGILTTELDIRTRDHGQRAFGTGRDGAAMIKCTTGNQLEGSIDSLTACNGDHLAFGNVEGFSPPDKSVRADGGIVNSRIGGDGCKDSGRTGVADLFAKTGNKLLKNGVIGLGLTGKRDSLADTLDAPLGIGEGSILFRKGGGRKNDMGLPGRRREENILDDQERNLIKCCFNLAGDPDRSSADPRR